MIAPHKTSGRTRIAIVRTGSGSSILLLLLLSKLEELMGCNGVRGCTFGVEFDCVFFVAGVAGVAGTCIVYPAGVVAEGVVADFAGVCKSRLKTGVFLGVIAGDRDGVCCAALFLLLSQTS